MGLTDHIAMFISELLSREDGVAELSRVELSQRFNCVPSQINYVISTRFSPEHGFIVESRRGGGGYIRITQVKASGENLIMHAINAVGDSIDARSATAFISNIYGSGSISEKSARIMTSAVSDSALRGIPPELRDSARAGILKQCLLSLLNND